MLWMDVHVWYRNELTDSLLLCFFLQGMNFESTKHFTQFSNVTPGYSFCLNKSLKNSTKDVLKLITRRPIR